MTFAWLLAAAAGSAMAAVIGARLTRQYALMALGGSALILVLHARLYLDYTPDDAYISYRYAQNLADGIGPFWNAGERVEGYSNFLWMAVLAGFSVGGADIEFTAAWLGLALAIAGCAGAYRLTTEMLPGDAGRLAGLAAALLLACSTTWALWGMSGLEGPLFGALTMAAVLLHMREARHPDAEPLSGAVWALVCMTRLDGLVLLSVSAAFKLAEARNGKSSNGSEHLRPALARILQWAGLFAIVFVPYFVWRWVTYGWLLPNTYYAKVGSGFDQYERGIRYSIGFLNDSGAWGLCIVPVAVAFTTIRRGSALYVLGLLVTWIAYISYVGGDFMLHHRLFAPVLPLAFGVIAASAAAIVERLTTSEARAYRVALGASFAVAAVLVGVFIMQPSTDLAIGEERELNAVRNEQGRWLRDNVPGSTTIAVYSAGAIPYQSGLPAIDILGLNDEHIAHRELAIGDARAGHEKYDSAYVLERRPDVIILADFRTGSPWTRADYDDLATYTTIPGVADLIRTPRLWEDYEPRAYRAENGRWFNMLVHREAVAVLATTQAARQ